MPCPGWSWVLFSSLWNLFSWFMKSEFLRYQLVPVAACPFPEQRWAGSLMPLGFLVLLESCSCCQEVLLVPSAWHKDDSKQGGSPSGADMSTHLCSKVLQPVLCSSLPPRDTSTTQLLLSWMWYPCSQPAGQCLSVQSVVPVVLHTPFSCGRPCHRLC